MAAVRPGGLEAPVEALNPTLEIRAFYHSLQLFHSIDEEMMTQKIS